MNKISLLVFLIFFSAEVFAEEEVVPLPHHRSISELLYERDISPIYGPRGFLNKVLELNGLTEMSARKLPVGYPVKLPAFVKATSSEEKLSIDTKTPEPEEPEASFVISAEKNHLLSVLPGYYFYQGEAESDGSFEAYGLFLNLQYAYKKNWEKLSLTVNSYINVYSVQDMDESFLHTHGLNLFLDRKLDKFTLGGGLSYQNLFYLYGQDERPRNLNLYLPGAFINLGRKFEQWQANIKAGLNLGGKENSHEIESSPYLNLSGSYSYRPQIQMNISSTIEKRTIDDYDQSFFSLSLGGSYLF